MKKEQLVEAGLTEEQSTKVLSIYKESIDGNYVAKHRFDEVNGELKTVREQISDRDKQIKDLSKLEGASKDLQDKLKVLEEENKTKDNQHKAALSIERKRNAVRLALLEDESKPHDPDMVLGLINLETVEYDEATAKLGKGFQDQYAGIKKDKAFLFNGKTAPIDPKAPVGLKIAGVPPIEGAPGTPPSDPSVGYGRSLAQIKLGMMGVDNAAKGEGQK